MSISSPVVRRARVLLGGTYSHQIMDCDLHKTLGRSVHLGVMGRVKIMSCVLHWFLLYCKSIFDLMSKSGLSNVWLTPINSRGCLTYGSGN